MTTESFECMICVESFPIERKMPASSLGCSPCAGEICTKCFVKDLYERKKIFYVTDNEDGTGRYLSQWDNTNVLMEFIMTQKQNTEEEDEEEKEAITELENSGDRTKYRAFIEKMQIKYVQIGRKCPFCNAMCTWRSNELPQMLDGKHTFYSPANVFRGVMPRNITEEIEQELTDNEEMHTIWENMTPGERQNFIETIAEMNTEERAEHYNFLCVRGQIMDLRSAGNLSNRLMGNTEEEHHTYITRIANMPSIIREAYFERMVELYGNEQEDEMEVVAERMEVVEDSITILAGMSLAEIHHELNNTQEALTALGRRVPSQADRDNFLALNQRALACVMAMRSFPADEIAAYSLTLTRHEQEE